MADNGDRREESAAEFFESLEDHFTVLEDLTEQEQDLVFDYIRKAAERGRMLEGEPVSFSHPGDQVAIREAVGRIDAIATEDVDELTLKAYMLERLKRNIETNLGGIIYPGDEFPEDATVTRDDLNKLLVADDVVNFFTLAGSIIEQLSIHLIMERIVANPSNSIRDDVQNLRQTRREWLLFITGTLDGGEKDQVRQAYRLRNTLAHNPEGTSLLNEIDTVEEDIAKTMTALNTLHEKLHGDSFESRMSRQ